MSGPREPQRIFDGAPHQEQTTDAQDVADVPTRAQPAPRARRTQGAATHVSLDAVQTSQQTSRRPTSGQARASQEAGARATAPTRALQKAPEDAQALATATRDEAKPVVISGARKPRPPTRHIVPRRSGPRSYIAQFMVAMIATAMVASVLSLSTPLGQAASLSAGGSFYALSNAAPWAPTPTHTPRPKTTYRPPIGSNPGQQAIINEIVAVFGSYSPGALNIAKCESGYDPNAWNSYPIMGSHASGVFQILYPSTWNSTSYSGYSPFNANANIHAAYQIFHRDGNSWREWQCKPY